MSEAMFEVGPTWILESPEFESLRRSVGVDRAEIRETLVRTYELVEEMGWSFSPNRNAKLVVLGQRVAAQVPGATGAYLPMPNPEDAGRVRFEHSLCFFESTLRGGLESLDPQLRKTYFMQVVAHEGGHGFGAWFSSDELAHSQKKRTILLEMVADAIAFLATRHLDGANDLVRTFPYFRGNAIVDLGSGEAEARRFLQVARNCFVRGTDF